MPAICAGVFLSLTCDNVKWGRATASTLCPCPPAMPNQMQVCQDPFSITCSSSRLRDAVHSDPQGKLRWAMAARNKGRLEAARDELARDHPDIKVVLCTQLEIIASLPAPPKAAGLWTLLHPLVC